MDAESKWPPTPPEGYQMHDSEYVQPWYVTVGLTLWVIGVFVTIPMLVIWVHGFESAVAIIREVFVFQIGTGELVLYVGWAGATLAILFGGHEALHALAGRWFGLKTEFHLDYSFPLDVTPSIVTHGEFQSRGESIAIIPCMRIDGVVAGVGSIGRYTTDPTSNLVKVTISRISDRYSI